MKKLNMHHGMLPFKDVGHLCSLGPFRQGRFARLFDLPPLYVNPLLLKSIGQSGGPMTETGPPKLTNNVPAGLIFFGQFIDHDITLDDSSSLTATNDPSSTENVRTPTLDLDNIYGDGPGGQPYLYDGVKLLTGADYADPAKPGDLKRDDLPRNAKDIAIIGDPRNDENRIISQLQLGFLRFHNKVVDFLEAKPNPLEGAALFTEARRLVTWHYQWIVINEYLPAVCGNWVVNDIFANGRKIYRPEHIADNKSKEPFIPIEFATAAYRFGHSMIPGRFKVQPGGAAQELFGPVLGPGFTPLGNPDAVVDWAALLDDSSGTYARAAALDTRLVPILLQLPFVNLPDEPSLAVRNLLRAQSFLVPAGEQVAHHMMASGADEITPQMIHKVRQAANNLGLPTATPLWLYVLAEGKKIGRLDEDASGNKNFEKGEGLGPVGARFVAEVIIGLLELDSRSFLGSKRNWSPTELEDQLGATGVTTLYQLLTFTP